MFHFAKEMNFDVRSPSNKIKSDRTLEKVPKSLAVMVSGISKVFLPSDLNELCDRLKLLLQESQAGNNSELTNNENVFMVDKLLDYKCMSKKQHKQTLIKCNLLRQKRSKYN